MKLHDLQPAPGSKTARTRVGRGIAAGKGKTAGRGTKGQQARAGGGVRPWFEGGQTPLQVRVPKLRGFRNRGRVEYEVVNLGRIETAVEQGRFKEAEEALAELRQAAPAGRRKADSAAPLTINPELLHTAGLIGSLRRPVKILGGGEVSRPLFIVADAFTASAKAKIEAAGGTAQRLESPSEPAAPAAAPDRPARGGRGPARGGKAVASDASASSDGDEPAQAD